VRPQTSRLVPSERDARDFRSSYRATKPTQGREGPGRVSQAFRGEIYAVTPKPERRIDPSSESVWTLVERDERSVLIVLGESQRVISCEAWDGWKRA
jgi:hypothetical protein